MTATGPSERCAAIARSLDEPLAGTAPTAPRWACLEHPDPWPRDIARHPDPTIGGFLDRATAAGFRPLLIRRAGPARAAPSRLVLLTDTHPATARTTAHSVTGPAELAELPLPEPGSTLPGDPVPHPQLLVCTADRDPCCETDGRTLLDALAAAGEPDVWACSHLGGHRFAPTAMLLPTGYLYGHLDLGAARAVRAAAAAGEMGPDRCRGRSTWSPAGQVAELAVRAATGLRAANTLTVHDEDEPTLHVTEAAGRRWAVDVERPDVDIARPASCGSRSTLMAPLRAAVPHLLPTADLPRP